VSGLSATPPRRCGRMRQRLPEEQQVGPGWARAARCGAAARGGAFRQRDVTRGTAGCSLAARPRWRLWPGEGRGSGSPLAPSRCREERGAGAASLVYLWSGKGGVPRLLTGTRLGLCCVSARCLRRAVLLETPSVFSRRNRG